MKQRILQIKVMLDEGIYEELFLNLILNCTNGDAGRPPSSYANRLKLDSWVELFRRKFTDLEVTEDQLRLFFKYMSRYYGQHVGEDHDYFYVSRYFSNELRAKINFQFESIVYITFEVAYS